MRIAVLAALVPFLFAASAEAKPLCREYTSVVKVGNRNQESYGTACLQADGSWQIQRPYDEVTYQEPEVIIIDRTPRRVHHAHRRAYYEPRTVFRVDFGDHGHRHSRHRDRDRYWGWNDRGRW